MATSMRPELVAANSGWKSIPSMLVVMPMRLAASLTISTSKPSKVPAAFLYSKGGLFGYEPTFKTSWAQAVAGPAAMPKAAARRSRLRRVKLIFVPSVADPPGLQPVRLPCRCAPSAASIHCLDHAVEGCRDLAGVAADAHSHKG